MKIATTEPAERRARARRRRGGKAMFALVGVIPARAAAQEPTPTLAVEGTVAVGYDVNPENDRACVPGDVLGGLGLRARVALRVRGAVGIGLHGAFRTLWDDACDPGYHLPAFRVAVGLDVRLHPLWLFASAARVRRWFDVYVGIGIDPFILQHTDVHAITGVVDPNAPRPPVRAILNYGVGVPLQVGFEFLPAPWLGVGVVAEVAPGSFHTLAADPPESIPRPRPPLVYLRDQTETWYFTGLSARVFVR